MYVLVAHEDPQRDGEGRVSLPVIGVYSDLPAARKAQDHDDNVIFAMGEEEARALVDGFEHDVKKSAHGMWCNTCSSLVANHIDSSDRFGCPNQPDVDL